MPKIKTAYLLVLMENKKKKKKKHHIVISLREMWIDGVFVSN
jgi:hypothetical protein